MPTKHSYISFCLVAAAVASPAVAFQPWENGVFPLKERIKKIDEALSLNFDESQAEYQTGAEHLRLCKERESFIHQRDELARQLEASEKIHNSSVVTYVAPVNDSFNSSLHTGGSAAGELSR